MARNRMIKPDYWHDEKIATLKRDVRLLFIGLWNISDDYGTVRAHPTWIKSQLFPYDDDLRADTITKWLADLVDARMLEPFTFNGERFYNIRTFLVHQKVEKPSKPIVPLDEKGRLLGDPSPACRGTLPEYSPNTPRIVGAEVEEEVEEEKRKNAQARDFSKQPLLAPSRPGHSPDWSAVLELFEMSNGTPQQAFEFFGHHEDRGWVDSHGRPFVHIAGAVNGWIARAAEKAAKATKPTKAKTPVTSGYIETERDRF